MKKTRIDHQSRRHRAGVLYACALLASACAAAREDSLPSVPGGLEAGTPIELSVGDLPSPPLEQDAVLTPEQDLDQDPAPAPPDFVDEEEWIRLNSGEWLKGEFVALAQDAVEFDSDELDTLSLDWGDIAEVITTRPFTVLRTDRSVVDGAVRVVDGMVYVTTEEGVVRFPRAELMRMIYANEDGVSWGGKIRLSATRRAGNTNQTDTSFTVSATRRTANSRTELYLDAVVSEVDSTQVANNQTFRGSHDLYLSPRFFLTPFGLELYSDKFQNIDLRATPYIGGGYTIIDRAAMEWNASAGLGYQYTRFDSVAVGEDDVRSAAALILGTDYDYDITKSVELEFYYQIQLGLEDIENTNQDASLVLSFDFIWDLDFDFRFQWSRVGQPVTNSDGVTPKKDDFRMDVGLAWDF